MMIKKRGKPILGDCSAVVSFCLSMVTMFQQPRGPTAVTPYDGIFVDENLQLYENYQKLETGRRGSVRKSFFCVFCIFVFTAHAEN